jgi:hypothetical protein
MVAVAPVEVAPAEGPVSAEPFAAAAAAFYQSMYYPGGASVIGLTLLGMFSRRLARDP